LDNKSKQSGLFCATVYSRPTCVLLRVQFTFLAVVPVIMQRVAAVTVTAVAANSVLALVLTSSIVHRAFVAICKPENQQPYNMLTRPTGLVILCAFINNNSNNNK